MEILVSRCRFIAVSERWIEARHSLTKGVLKRAPHAGVVHIAYCGAQTALRQRLQREPRFFEALSKAFAAARSPSRCLAACGMENHPAVVQLRTEYSDLNKKCSDKLSNILYHVDAGSLHGQLPCEGDPAERYQRSSMWGGGGRGLRLASCSTLQCRVQHDLVDLCCSSGCVQSRGCICIALRGSCRVQCSVQHYLVDLCSHLAQPLSQRHSSLSRRWFVGAAHAASSRTRPRDVRSQASGSVG